MAKLHDGFVAKGVGLAAISVDPQDASAKLAEELKVRYSLLSDPNLKVALGYGVAMKGEDIAVPAVFIVHPDRRIVWKHVGESITDRPSDQEITRHVDEAIANWKARGKTNE